MCSFLWSAPGGPGLLVLVESDHGVLPDDQKLPDAVVPHAPAMADDDEEAEEEVVWDESVFGQQRGEEGSWGSAIRVVESTGSSLTSMQLINLTGSEAAFSVCPIQFHERPGEWFVAVGTAVGLTLNPRTMSAAFIHLYRVNPQRGWSLEFVHKTPVDEVPGAMCGFQGRLLVGVGSLLRIYDLGKRKLLRKCECKQLPNRVMHISTQGDRIYVGDVGESFFFCKFKAAENQVIQRPCSTTLSRLFACSCGRDCSTLSDLDTLDTRLSRHSRHPTLSTLSTPDTLDTLDTRHPSRHPPRSCCANKALLLIAHADRGLRGRHLPALADLSSPAGLRHSGWHRQVRQPLRLTPPAAGLRRDRAGPHWRQGLLVR